MDQSSDMSRNVHLKTKTTIQHQTFFRSQRRTATDHTKDTRKQNNNNRRQRKKQSERFAARNKGKDAGRSSWERKRSSSSSSSSKWPFEFEFGISRSFGRVPSTVPTNRCDVACLSLVSSLFVSCLVSSLIIPLGWLLRWPALPG